MRTRGLPSNFSCSTASVRSFEPSSTQTTSSTGGSCASSDSTVRAITDSSLYAGTTTETVSSMGGCCTPRLRARLACSGARIASSTARSASSPMANPKSGPSARARAPSTLKTTLSAPATSADAGARGAGGSI
jgi:hypothetical protein